MQSGTHQAIEHLLKANFVLFCKRGADWKSENIDHQSDLVGDFWHRLKAMVKARGSRFEWNSDMFFMSQ